MNNNKEYVKITDKQGELLPLRKIIKKIINLTYKLKLIPTEACKKLKIGRATFYRYADKKNFNKKKRRNNVKK
ncbi:MAG: hypothetical protein BV457_00045 [Thermoplasmata archaeon M9B1D]|nr:MAG: hypothetical protein BV457_00045 [Thermoplasmata archaeon M9B1D]PNX52245.1 MAG: hypothetical protein BV456_00250 [Thermoplasmata archaeon M8B2D]